MSDKLSRILLVEDNPGDARLLHELVAEITPQLFEVMRVERLSQALEILARQSFDVVLLDLSLPDTSGIETFNKLCEQVPDVPIVVLSGLQDDSIALAAVQNGAQDYLVKGEVNPPLLARSLRYAIERHRMQEALRTMSLVDDLTGLYNRRGFLTLSAQQLKTGQRTDAEILLIYADLDGMKCINDTYGHHEGDWALKKVAEALRQTYRESDIIARLGGDEFSVCALVHGKDDAMPLQPRLEENLDKINLKENRPYKLALSFGAICFKANEVASIEAMLEEADRLLYEEKRKRKTLLDNQ